MLWHKSHIDIVCIDKSQPKFLWFDLFVPLNHVSCRFQHWRIWWYCQTPWNSEWTKCFNVVQYTWLVLYHIGRVVSCFWHIQCSFVAIYYKYSTFFFQWSRPDAQNVVDEIGWGYVDKFICGKKIEILLVAVFGVDESWLFEQTS